MKWIFLFSKKLCMLIFPCFCWKTYNNFRIREGLVLVSSSFYYVVVTIFSKGLLFIDLLLYSIFGWLWIISFHIWLEAMTFSLCYFLISFTFSTVLKGDRWMDIFSKYYRNLYRYLKIHPLLKVYYLFLEIAYFLVFIKKTFHFILTIFWMKVYCRKIEQ